MALGELNSFNALIANEPDTPFIRRSKVRVLFAVVEAHIYHLQWIAYAASKINPSLFTDEEIWQLQGKRLRNGAVENARVSLKDSIKFAFGAFAKARGIAHPVDFGGKGGQAFLLAVDIRDRVTHPKTTTDWSISDADNGHIDSGWKWFGEHLVEISRSSI